MARHGSADPVLPSFESFLDGIGDSIEPRPKIISTESFRSSSTASSTTSPIYAAFATTPLASPTVCEPNITSQSQEPSTESLVSTPSKSSTIIASTPVISLHHSESTENISKSNARLHKQSSSSTLSAKSVVNSLHTSKSSTSVVSTINLAPPKADKRKSSAFAGLSDADRDMLVALMYALDNGDQLAVSQDVFANEQKRPALRTAQTSPPTAEKISSVTIAASGSEDALFLYNPRMTQRLPLPSGRVVCFAEVGDRDGWPVFLHLGMGCSRYFAAFFDDLASSYNLRLIAIDRPGIGHSDDVPKSELKLLNWPKVVQHVADALGIDQFSLVAHSAGSPFALATALELKNRVQGTVQLLAPWAPLSVTNNFKWLKYVPTSVIKMTNSAGIKTQALMMGKPAVHKPKRNADHEATSPMGISSPVTSPPPSPQHAKKSPGLGIKRSFKNLRKKAQEESPPPLPSSPFEQSTPTTPLSLPLSVAILRASYSESLSVGANNDLITIFERHHAFGFAYSDIQHPVHIYHGSADDRIPLKAAQWMVSNMPNCSLTVLDGAGHHLMMRADVMECVMKRIAADVHTIGKCRICHSEKKPGLIYGDYKGWCLHNEEQIAERNKELKIVA